MSAEDHNDWENDPVWNLVEEAKPREAGPFFARNVMREIRLSEEKAAPWWQRLLSPKPLLAGALGTAAAVAIIATLGPDTGDSPAIGQTPETPENTPVVQEVDDLLDEELLMAASEDPSAFSDEALVGMLY